MNNVLLLDCTLRDGGFVNDWNFGFGSIKSIYSRLNSAKIDIIEVGLIDDRRNYDENRSIFPDAASINRIFNNLNRPVSKIVAMIDFGTCNIKRICLKKDSILDGIRVIFKKKDQDAALSYLEQIKTKGYEIFVNPVSITGYSDTELQSLINKINKIQPTGVTVVDTYGLLHNSELLHYFDLYDKYLNKGITLAYHAHNNFQMAYSNSISLMNKVIERDIIIDGTLFGMGKSAGNACTELLAMYMNEFKSKNYDINQIQEAIDSDIQREFQKKPWGYNFEYYISALNDCHPYYVSFLRNKRSLSVKTINLLLNKIPEDKKLSFDEKLIQEIYDEHQRKDLDDSIYLQKISKEFENNNILLLGPGKTIETENSKIIDYINKYKPVVITTNFVNNSFPVDYVFMSNAKRYSQFFDKIYGDFSKIQLICTSNITDAGKTANFILNYSSLICEKENIRDNPLILFLKLLSNINIPSVTIAGFDGYTDQSHSNYYGSYVPFLYCNDDLLARNEALRDEISKMQNKIHIESLTKTEYIYKCSI